ncbi:MAG TPA: hypothetical protein VL171_06655 [Verrucomicrobiae bacterium]|nr:hypothetical protein [Verrucomicrobiae bacterium]
MKKLASVLCVVCLFVSWLSATAVAAGEKLTNASVVEMHKLGLGDNVVIEKIKVSACNFDVGLDALKQLKDDGISDAIIQAMIAVGSPTKPETAATVGTVAGDPNDPQAAHETGIWLFQQLDGKNKMTMLTPNTFDQVTTGGGWGVAWGGTAKSRAVLQGEHADLQIPSSVPVFYFYFDRSGSSLSSASKVATAPNDFSLVQMEIRKSKHQRRLEIGKVNLGGSKQGLSPKVIRAIQSEKVGDGIYKVTPQENLKDGEYAFVYNASQYGGKVFDFGVEAGMEASRK